MGHHDLEARATHLTRARRLMLLSSCFLPSWHSVGLLKQTMPLLQMALLALQVRTQDQLQVHHPQSLLVL